MNALCKIFLLICAMILLWGLPGSKAQNPSDIRRTYYWYFGNGAGLDFSSGDPVPLTDGAMTAEEGCATISDTCGDLLFYTDGDTVWNKNHQVMPNGTGLMGCWSSTQSSLIVPQPGNDSIYYIFLTDCGENPEKNGLRYSVVNVKLNGGLGGVIEKNTLLYKPSMEKLAATYHANGVDVWVLSVNTYPAGPPPPDTTYQYYAHLLTSSGVNTSPVISSSAIHPHKLVDGYLRFSHSGNLVANVFHTANPYRDTVELFSFNTQTGILFNSLQFVPLQDTLEEPYGLVFSPDDSKLYASVYNTILPYPDWRFKVFQYDISVLNADSIAATQKLIQYSDSTDPFLQEYMALQTGSNGKVYVSRLNNAGSGGHPTTLDVITNPNATGPACGYSEDGVDIGGNSQAGLPNFIDSYFSGPWQPPCNTGIEVIEAEGEIFVYPNPLSDYANIRIQTKNLRSKEEFTLTLHNLFGSEVKKTIFKSNEYLLHRDGLPGGIYLMRISNGNFNHTSKLIIQ